MGFIAMGYSKIATDTYDSGDFNAAWKLMMLIDKININKNLHYGFEKNTEYFGNHGRDVYYEYIVSVYKRTN